MFDVHREDAHPYAPFPLDRIEEAVKSVPLSSYPDSERPLAQFGTPARCGVRFESKKLLSFSSQCLVVGFWCRVSNIFLVPERLETQFGTPVWNPCYVRIWVRKKPEE